MQVKKSSGFFPFYQVDGASWRPLQDRELAQSWPQLETHLRASVASDEVELLQLISLDAKSRLTASKIIAVGTIDHLLAKIRTVAGHALAQDAAGVILAHNHTSGNVAPSWDDVSYTRTLNHAFHKLGITLIDHCIVTKHALFSMRANCLIF